MADDSGSYPAAAATTADWAIFGDELKVVEPAVSSDPSGSGGDVEQELLEPYAKFRDAPLNALSELGLHFLGTAWRSYDQVIGQPIYYPGFTERMKGLVLAQPRLRAKIRELAMKRVEVEMPLPEGSNSSSNPPSSSSSKKVHSGKKGQPTGDAALLARRVARRIQIEDELTTVADDWTDRMICKMESRYFIRGAYYLATQLLTRAYHQGIHVNSAEVMHLREVAKEAARKKQSIIFLPCHRSHVDYVSLQVICYRLGMALPNVVAGDNLNFPLIGSFLQRAGAFYIRRSFGDDQLYTSLVQSYVDSLLQDGHNVECFVEGTRSRTGKLLQPKFGILSFYLDSILSGRVEDAWVCPVSTQYDKVIEVDSYISELLGKEKKKEDLAGFLSASNVLSLKLGRVDVRFQKPWSLRAFVNDQASRLVKQQPTQQHLNDPAIKRQILSKFGYQVLLDINEVSVVMPTALVGTVLLTLVGRAVGRAELIRRVGWLSARVKAQNGRLAHFAGSAVESVVDKALEVLGPKLVGRVDEHNLPEEMYYAADRFQLSFYRNMTIHLFISQALVCAAVFTAVKREGPGARIAVTELYDYVFFLSQLFRAEFIFPTTPFADNFRATLDALIADEVLLAVPAEESSSSAPPASDGKFADIAYIEVHPSERAHALENLDFYCFLIWPFIEAAWLSTVSIFMLVPPPHLPADANLWCDLKLFTDKAQLLGKTLFHRGDLSFYEAVNKEALKNALGRAVEEGIVVITKSKDARIPQRIQLQKGWMPPRDAQGHLTPSGDPNAPSTELTATATTTTGPAATTAGVDPNANRLWRFCQFIARSRRKEGAGLTGRVFALAESIAADLFETAVPEADGLPKVTRRRKGIRTQKEKVKGGSRAKL